MAVDARRRGEGRRALRERDAFAIAESRGGEREDVTKPTNPRPGRVSPNEVVAGLAGSAICMLVSTAARLAKRRFRRKLSERESARLEAMKQELRDAMDQLREQRRTLDHLAAQNKEMAIENQQLKRQAAEVAEVVSRGVSTPKGVLSLPPPRSPRKESPASEKARGRSTPRATRAPIPFARSSATRSTRPPLGGRGADEGLRGRG